MYLLEDAGQTKGATFGSPLSLHVDKHMAQSIVKNPVAYYGAFWEQEFLRPQPSAGMNTATGLHAGFLVGAEHVVALAEGLAVKDSSVQVEHPGCFDDKVRVTWGDPGPMLPGFERVSGQPASHRGG